MPNLKNEKGSITLFVVISCVFFIALVVCVQIQMQSKQIAVDREYRQVKSNYETDINNINDIYSEVSDVEINMETPILNNNTISVKFTINRDSNNIKYGWYYSGNTTTTNLSKDDITNWGQIESGSLTNIVTTSYEDKGTGTHYYYLCVCVDGNYLWSDAIEVTKE